jgi:hypothetical protein
MEHTAWRNRVPVVTTKAASLVCGVVSLLLVGAASAGPRDTPCVGILAGGVFDNVVVPPGERCTLSNTVVEGDVKARENSQLVIENSTIGGNVKGDRADLVQVHFSVVRGNIDVKKGGPALAPFPVGTLFCGRLEVDGCEAVVFATTVQNGHIKIEQMVGDVIITGSQVTKRDVRVKDNLLATSAEFMLIESNEIAGHLEVIKNTGSGPKSVHFNAVGERIGCLQNGIPFAGGPNVALKSEGQCF